uniref:Uncharacterized protein n=1 Tax=Pyxicephalus adspersus TaxID=30357 RepID=A0AAV2ZTL4_PYXAD|nr:TPA: hypothetical protein GDO54_002751 [Pyxicephalus adspersus]
MTRIRGFDQHQNSFEQVRRCLSIILLNRGQELWRSTREKYPNKPQTTLHSTGQFHEIPAILLECCVCSALFTHRSSLMQLKFFPMLSEKL